MKFLFNERRLTDVLVLFFDFLLGIRVLGFLLVLWINEVYIIFLYILKAVLRHL